MVTIRLRRQRVGERYAACGHWSRTGMSVRGSIPRPTHRVIRHDYAQNGQKGVVKLTAHIQIARGEREHEGRTGPRAAFDFYMGQVIPTARAQREEIRAAGNKKA